MESLYSGVHFDIRLGYQLLRLKFFYNFVESLQEIVRNLA